MSRRERQRRRQRHRGHPVKRVVLVGVVLAVCGAAFGASAVVGWALNVLDSAPNISQLKPRNQGQISQVFAANGTSLGYIESDVVRTYVHNNRIPRAVKEATVAIEDRRFYQHGGVDYQGILRAGIKDLFGGGKTIQGGSTLTMQLVDNIYLPNNIRANHNLRYKLVQAKLAEQLEAHHTKPWILTTYLNDVPYGTVGGQTAYGIGAAAEMFFNRPVSTLDLAQSALLAGLPQAPSEYNPFLFPDYARRRRAEVLTAMVKSHYITQAQADEANRQSLGVQANTSYGVHEQPYFFDYVEQALHQKFCPGIPAIDACPKVDQGGLKIYTTIDLQKQQEARAAILAHEGGPGQPAAALVTIDPSDGHILAMASSSSYAQTNFNYAADAERQPGSAFKVFALMTLIHDYDGDPNQTYYNSHFLAAGWLPSDPSWSVHTAEETYQGDIDVTKATIVSDNTVFAQMAADLGWAKLDAMAHSMGVTTPLDGNPSEVIGGLRIGVTPLEMADAYATIANGGSHFAATAITKVVFPDGSSINLGDPTPKRVFSNGETYAATNVLKGVVTSGTGTAASYGCPAAGKTGTAENLDNAWFVGYTPKLSTAVWVGYPQGNIPMADGFGGALAAPIWHDYMEQASDGYCGDFSVPTDPWHGIAYVGPHSSTGAPRVGVTGSGSGSAGTGSGKTTSTNPYNNPTLFAQPPQAPSPGTTGHGHAGAPPGFGTGHTPGSGTGKTPGSGGAGVHKR